MAKYTKNQLKGNQAESTVAGWLKERCLVRPVASDTDVGIDLYCESVDPASDEPFLHFWVQVRSGQQVHVIGANQGVKCSTLECKELLYWLRQPVPVYVFLLPDASKKDFYIVSLTQELFRNPGIRQTSAEQKTLTLETQLHFGEGQTDLDTFVDTFIPVDYVLKAAQEGIVRRVPQVMETYLKQSIPGLLNPYADKVADNVRIYASRALADMLGSSRLMTDVAARQMAFFASVLRHFTQAKTKEEAQSLHPNGKWHFEDYVRLGCYLNKKGQVQEGTELIKTACTCIDSDPEYKAKYEALGKDIEELKRQILSLRILPG